MRKKIISIILLVAMVLTMAAGCGKKEDKKDYVLNLVVFFLLTVAFAFLMVLRISFYKLWSLPL